MVLVVPVGRGDSGASESRVCDGEDGACKIQHMTQWYSVLPGNNVRHVERVHTYMHTCIRTYIYTRIHTIHHKLLAALAGH